MFSYLTSMQ